MNILKDDIRIEKELPPHLKSLDVEAIGSQVCNLTYDIMMYLRKQIALVIKHLAFQITDADLVKEATPADYIQIVLPLLLRNGVVHFLGYANRLGFDPMPSNIQVKQFYLGCAVQSTNVQAISPFSECLFYTCLK